MTGNDVVLGKCRYLTVSMALEVHYSEVTTNSDLPPTNMNHPSTHCPNQVVSCHDHFGHLANRRGSTFCGSSFLDTVV